VHGGLTPVGALGLVYAAGLLFFLLRAAETRRRVRRRVATADRLPTGSDVAGELESLAARVGARGRVRAAVSEACSMPFVAGAIRPVICLPTSALSWTGERRRVVLLHELAHVRRRDGLWRLLGELACAVHWWNPLAWAAARRAREYSEAACDDLVLREGRVRASVYATHLLALAAGPKSPWWARSAAGAASPSGVERRVEALADGERRRGPVPAGWAWFAGVLCGVALLPLGAIAPAFTQAPETPAPPQAPASREAAAPPQAPASLLADAPASPETGIPRSLRAAAPDPPVAKVPVSPEGEPPAPPRAEAPARPRRPGTATPGPSR
jgi:beta-lactamase regulating signal transducer with metallopeptidase domain